MDENIYGNFDNSLVEAFLTSLAPYSEKITTCFNEVAFRLKSDKNQGKEIDTQLLIEEIDKQLGVFRRTGITHKFGSDDLERLSVVVSSILSILRSLDKISVPVSRITGEAFVMRPVEAV